ncbi:MAG: TonB-dependent receptor [Candidatus Eremiobacteraeota bacterium]|nr:TonB-dependent receptor [Candidatus Eremiobacteraeota bacterium]
MQRSLFKRIVVGLAALALSWLPAQFALGGTTGALHGVVTSEGKPLAGAVVTASSPSGTSTAVTDAGGHFTFVSLSPDDYTLTVEKPGYDRASFSGAVVFADATQVVTLVVHRTLLTIARTTSRSSSSLVRPGTTADVYSVNAKEQERASVLGGGGTLDSAYSAIATVPGAYVPTNQAGYNLAVHIRGGDSSEVGYELDGIPMNRIIDGYPSGSLSSLGQLELQVYTGASPADSEGQGLAGFVNQVIKTGTTPGYATANATVGTPTFYHSLNVEVGGATPDRLFSYYAGIGGFNQDHRYVDQFNGAAYANEFGPILDNCPAPHAHGYVPPASCYTNGALNVGQAGAPGYILGPMPFGNENAGVTDRSTLFNVHFGIPHSRDALRDDVQVLYDNDTIFSPLYVSAYDEGLQNFQGATYPAGTTPYYSDWYQYVGQPGTFLPSPALAAKLVTPYYFPSSPANRAFQAPLPLTTRDVQYNQQAVTKLQYQKNFSSDAYLRVYGYTYFATYASAGAMSSWQPYTGYDSGDYELNAHTRGLGINFGKQFGSEHLVTLEGSYTTATSMDYNNSEMFGSADNFAVLVDPRDLARGICYAAPRSGTTATPTSCNPGTLGLNAPPATFASLGGIASGTTYDPTKYTCGGVTCAYYVAETGPYGQVERVTPTFYGVSAVDEYRPTDKLVLNAGLRLDNYQFVGEDTTGGAARAFWMTAFNHDTCYNTSDLTLYDKTQLQGGASIPITSPCSAAGPHYQTVHMENVPTDFVYNLWQPRVGATYTIDADTVLRASWGKYNEQPSSSYEQYNALQQNLPTELIPYYSQGFNSPGHEVRPAISFNSDFSVEHHFKGTQLSIKLSPFLRQTHDEIENFYIDIKEGIIAGLNAGNETSQGFELALNDGDFDHDGFAGQLSFAYTNVYVKYSALPNGTTILSPINADIANYNAYTSSCAAGGGAAGKREFGIPLCGVTTTGAAASACYVPVFNGSSLINGKPSACSARGAYANPYWNAPVQALLDPNGAYLPYSVIPGTIGTGVNAYNYPYVATALLNYKHGKFAISPSFQFVAGNRYGAPETMPGIDPAAGCTVLSGRIAGDPRYPYGAPGGRPYDSHTCLGQLNAIPDSFTGVFDSLGAFREPSQMMAHLRMSYDVSPRLSLTLTLANIVSTCFGGQQTPFTYYWSHGVCQYGSLSQAYPPVGNVYNPRDNVQTFQRYPYEPDFGTYNDLNDSTVAPFSAYVGVRVKI